MAVREFNSKGNKNAYVSAVKIYEHEEYIKHLLYAE